MTRRLVPVLLFAVVLSSCADANAPGPVDPTVEPAFALMPALDSAATLSAGFLHACAIDTAGEAWCWGWNGFDQLGAPTTELCNGSPCSWKPVRVRSGRAFAQISAGSVHTCAVEAITRDAYCWGDGSLGQLGNRSTSGSLTPVFADAGVPFSQVAAGGNHTCGLSTNGRIWCWGDNSAGQAGGTGGAVSIPRVLPGTRTYRQVSTGYMHTCAIDEEDVAWCWGSNAAGQGGNVATMGSDSREPRRVAGETRWKWIGAGEFHTCGVSTGGLAFCWGHNDAEQLGRPGGDSHRPLRVAGAGYTRVTAGSQHSCGLRANGAVVCWGAGHNGQLGRDTLAITSPPGRIAGTRTYSSVTAGTDSFTCAAHAGDIYCWGRNVRGTAGRDPATSPLCFGDRCQPRPVRLAQRTTFETTD